MWKTEIVPCDENVYIWITDRKDRSKSRPIVIETRDKKTILINYPQDVYSVDIDRKDK